MHVSQSNNISKIFCASEKFWTWMCYKNITVKDQILLVIEKYLCNSGCSDWQSGQDSTFKAFFLNEGSTSFLSDHWMWAFLEKIRIFLTRKAMTRSGTWGASKKLIFQFQSPFFLTFVFHFSHLVFSTSLYQAFLRSSVPTVAAGVTHPSLLMSVAATA